MTIELGGSVFEITHDLVGVLFRAKNAGVTEHKQSYPILSIMARDIMAVHVSIVSSESCFSLTGRILEERRRRLLPEHVEMLTCIKD
jgi:hypothetical protein